MSDDRAISVEQERAEASEATDRKHGEHILGMVRGQNQKQPDPLFKLLERAHQARLDAERGGTPGGDEAA
jgi:hypothetical protein